MLPKKSSSLYIEIAETLDCSQTLVEDIVEFYYSELRKKLSDLTSPRINAEGLGHFVAKPSLVRKSIIKYTNILKNHDTSTYGAYFNKKMLENKLELLIKLEQDITTEEKRKNNFKAKKYGTDNNSLGES